MQEKITEASSHYEDLEKMSTSELLSNINAEDQTVALSVSKAIPQIEHLVDAAYTCMQKGGRLFYLGSGTSGRLGILDASECPPTYGVDFGLVVGLIAGGDGAIRKAKEKAEDDLSLGWKDLLENELSQNDFVVGISASGTTPYVLGALKKCNEKNIATGGITCNHKSPLAALAKYPVEAVVGPEFVTGSTRMKAGTAQKMVLNMISTSLMIKLGKVRGNKMVDMKLSNQKLVERGTSMLVELYGILPDEARKRLLEAGSVRAVIKQMEKG